jgi:transketolase C-terminal domain/subunit
MRATCLNMVHDLAKRDRRVIFIGSDLSPGLLAEKKNEMPERWFKEGVTEAKVIGMAAGLAMEGYIPYVNTIATFITRRCYEQVAIDLCLHDLPVRLIGNGGGLVYAPLGPTHLAIEDLAIMRALPNMTVTAVCARLAQSHLHPACQGRRSGGQSRRKWICHRQSYSDASGTLAKIRCADDDGRDDDQRSCCRGNARQGRP